MHEDCATLGLQAPDLEPSLGVHRPDHRHDADFDRQGYAYVAGNGDVMYSVRKFPGTAGSRGSESTTCAPARAYRWMTPSSSLGFRALEAREAGRAFVGFALGDGRPGWHIECSAMSTSLLGSYFDLHGGGEDLKFPHHENEIAQSCAACDTPFVHVWMHNGFVRVNDEKMSKSLGNSLPCARC